MSTSTTAMPVTTNWIRPWYPAGKVGHLSPDCPELLLVEPCPSEGAGWLDPADRHTCETCLQRHGYVSWHAECKTCGICLCDEYKPQPYISEADAKRWKFEHECEPVVVLEAPPKAVTPPQPANQAALFPIAELTAVEAAA